MAGEGQEFWLLTLTGFSSNADGCSEDAKGKDKGDGSRLRTTQRYITHIFLWMCVLFCWVLLLMGFCLFVCLWVSYSPDWPHTM